MIRAEKLKLYNFVSSKFKDNGEHTPWVNVGDSQCSGNHRFIRQIAIGDRMIQDYIEFSPDKDPNYAYVRLERTVDDHDEKILYGEASDFVLNGYRRNGNKTRSGGSGANGLSITWENRNNKRALKKVKEMVSRI